MENIIKNGGLYSWKDCEERGINIPKPGGGGSGSPSWSLDKRDGLEHYVRVSFTMNHPMMYVAMNEDRISNPVILEIDPEVIYDEITKYADRNAVRNGAHVGGSLEDFTMVKNPGKENMEIITKDGQKINRYTPSEDQSKRKLHCQLQGGWQAL